MANGKRGAPVGNQNARKNKFWINAIRNVTISDPEALDEIARKLFEMAKGGDIQAIREIGDRLDGKPTQALHVAVKDATHADELSDDELARIAAGSSFSAADAERGEKELH